MINFIETENTSDSFELLITDAGSTIEIKVPAGIQNVCRYIDEVCSNALDNVDDMGSIHMIPGTVQKIKEFGFFQRDNTTLIKFIRNTKNAILSFDIVTYLVLNNQYNSLVQSAEYIFWLREGRMQSYLDSIEQN